MIDMRLALPLDFESIARSITSEKELFLVYPSGKFPLDVKQVEELYGARKDFTVVTYRDKIMGFANLYDYVEGDFCFIGNVFISHEYRGKGYGKSLLDFMINRAKGYSLQEVKISVFSDNTQALLLYTQLGFELYASEEQEDFKKILHTLLHMRLPLNKRLP